MIVYELTDVSDNPAYEGFNCSQKIEGASLLEAFTVDYTSDKKPIPPSLSNRWPSIFVEGNVHPLNDYPCINGSIPAFSERAVTELRDILSAAGELLPFEHQGRTYHALNVQCMPQVLDRDRTESRWSNQIGFHATTVHRFEFIPERLAGVALFRLYEQPYTICATDMLRERVEQLSLQGFVFHRLWPLAPEELWWKLRKKTWAETKALPPPTR